MGFCKKKKDGDFKNWYEDDSGGGGTSVGEYCYASKY